ncbi:hypothetical protein SNE40_012919 [Patella caerulea]|uniref:Uncharacterized protein n=1 Tax=Patella caerulea TaxID=87958 RepID=A0AAN8JQF8_PATCE
MTCLQPYRCDDAEIRRYYLSQTGDGFPIFTGSPYQKGYGLGSVLSSLFRVATPLLKSAAKTVGKKALTTGAQIFGDVLHGKNLKTSAKQHLLQASRDLSTRALKNITGPIKGPTRQGGVKRVKQARGKKRKRRKQTSSDIFS